MNLKDYLLSTETSQSDLAKKLGVSQGLIHQWLSGRTRIIAERCAAIEAATNGAVTQQDLRPDIFGAPPAPKRKAKAT